MLGYFITEYKVLFTFSLAKVSQQWPFYITPFLMGIFIVIYEFKFRK